MTAPNPRLYDRTYVVLATQTKHAVQFGLDPSEAGSSEQVAVERHELNQMPKGQQFQPAGKLDWIDIFESLRDIFYLADKCLREYDVLHQFGESYCQSA
jgi:hypothetical protein